MTAHWYAYDGPCRAWEPVRRLLQRRGDRVFKSFDKNIAKHEAWLRDPTSKVKGFHSLRPEHQQNLLHHWSQDIARHQELREIAQEVLKGL